MRMLPTILLVLGVLLAAFAFWGLSTRSGRARFDEMAGMIPLAAGALAGVLFLGALACWWFRGR